MNSDAIIYRETKSILKKCSFGIILKLIIVRQVQHFG